MTDRLVILADDFTGACDAAGAFGPSHTTHVVLGAPHAWPANVEVLAVDLDLRERSAAEAQAITEATARQLGQTAPDARFFLKIDSTLRGPIAGLIAGALHGCNKEIAVVAPAFPEQGRVFREGKLFVHGRETASLHEVLGNSHQGHILVDAETIDTLRNLAVDWGQHPEWLLVGSAGLARQLAASRRGHGHKVRVDLASTSGPLLVVAGSPAAATQEQLRHVRKEEVVVLSTPPAAERDQGQAADALAEDVAEWAASHRPRAVVLTGGATARQVFRRLGSDGVHVAGELHQYPGIPFGRFVGGQWEGVLVVTKAGGFGPPQTLLDVARALGVSSPAQ